MRNIISVSLCVILLVAGASCSKSDDNNNDQKGAAENIKYLNITDATNLIIASSRETSNTKSVKSDENPELNVLYKLTEDGLLVEVNYTDENGNEVNNSQHYKPLEVKNLNDDYVLICFLAELDPIQNVYKFIVRKSDGAVFKAPLGVSPYNVECYYSSLDFNIGDEDFYYIGSQESEGYAIFNLFLDNSGNMFEKQISIESDGHDFEYFFVDSHGNYMYPLDNVLSENHRVIAKSGSISSQENLNPKVIGPGGYIYSIDEKDIFKLVIEDDASITKDLYGTLSEDIDLNHFYQFGDKVLCIEPSGKVVDIFGGGSDIIVHSPVQGLITGEMKVMISGDYYFFAGYSGAQFKIFRMDINTHLPEEMPVDFSPFEFKLDDVMMVNENEVMCSGLRLSDAAWVNYKADFYGNIELLDEDFHNMEVVQLERIQ